MTKIFKNIEIGINEFIKGNTITIDGLIMGIDKPETENINIDIFEEKDIVAVCPGEISDDGVFNIKDEFEFKKKDLKYKYIYFLWRIEGKDGNNYIFPVKGSDRYMEVVDDISIK